MADPDEESANALTARLKAALWYSVGKAVDEETLRMGVNATPQFIGALSEMMWAQIESASEDLESFAKHAGRKTIVPDDVMLLTRRNEGLESLLRGYYDEMKPATAATGAAGKKRGRKSAP